LFLVHEVATRSLANRQMKVISLKGVNDSESMSADESSRLVSECIAGDERAIESLVRQYETGVFRLALSVVDDPIEASEVTQETFISALKALRTYRDQSSFKSWIYKIAFNKSRSHLRKQKILERLRSTLTTIFQVEAQKALSPEEAIIENEEEAAVWKSLNKLNEHHRIVVILRYFHELSVAEIAEILSIHEGTIHSRLHNARERLRVELASFHGK
jgi:RNA polymerase sigma-70 factor (ECF subfamily)